MKRFAVVALVLILGSLAYAAETKSPEQIYSEADYVLKIVIHSQSSTHYENWGSGFILNLPNYGFCVLTVRHHFNTLPSPYLITAYFKDGTPPQKLQWAATSEKYDAVILKFSDPEFKPKKVAKIGRSSSLRPGSRVMNIGSNNLGDFCPSINGFVYLKPGPLSASLRTHLKNEGARWRRDWPTIILSDLKVFRGHSGSPLINEDGEVVGIIVGFLRMDFHTINIALPIDDLNLSLLKRK